ncbi:hypothetical protein NHX12_024476 [Muraenolepis orangiensis]|uniref:Uncharacterized protein n=1 Tax=Muraenolepis orangiensis TaxID=630683 RepID=A0A9Q0EHG9_9TELE|nr:hypothetical protein NHX12_024476 [Muraenolepis orangiensis]
MSRIKSRSKRNVWRRFPCRIFRRVLPCSAVSTSSAPPRVPESKSGGRIARILRPESHTCGRATAGGSSVDASTVNRQAGGNSVDASTVNRQAGGTAWTLPL